MSDEQTCYIEAMFRDEIRSLKPPQYVNVLTRVCNDSILHVVPPVAIYDHVKRLIKR